MVTSDYISRGLGWVASVKSWVGLGWVTENGPTAMSALNTGRIAIFDQHVTICVKRQKIGPWSGNRKSYALYQTVIYPMILSDVVTL